MKRKGLHVFQGASLCVFRASWLFVLLSLNETKYLFLDSNILILERKIWGFWHSQPMSEGSMWDVGSHSVSNYKTSIFSLKSWDLALSTDLPREERGALCTPSCGCITGQTDQTLCQNHYCFSLGWGKYRPPLSAQTGDGREQWEETLWCPEFGQERGDKHL